ncbi:MAG: type II toxin-antitoxin system VapC family toxin [Candidatus Micrarchaeota archaeon]|nr:type II toxin-antitoxin system VapC family toxin [Candidatus Micrarchaeota archaeon]
MIVIDTDVLIEIFEKASNLGETAFSKIEKSMEEFATTAINLHEVLHGTIKYGKPSEYIAVLPVLSYTKADAVLSSELEYRAEAKGRRVTKPDAMIAAIAINNGAKLYTFNKSHFKGFEDLGLNLFS